MGEVAKREISEQRVERGKKGSGMGGPPLHNTAPILLLLLADKIKSN